MRRHEKVELGFLVVWVGTKCTLHCKACANMIPYAKQVDYDIEDVIKDLKRVLKYAKVKKIQIQGGEPFLNKGIIKLIRIIDKLDVEEILITTNGTVRLDDAVIQALKKIKNPHFFINVSNYECVKAKQTVFVDKLRKEGIPVQYYAFKDGDGDWRDYGDINTPQNKNNAAVQGIFNHCDTKYCNTLAKGKIYRCGRAVITEEYYELDLKENKDYIDVHNLKKRNASVCLKAYYYEQNFPEYCRYCLGATKRVTPGEQMF